MLLSYQWEAKVVLSLAAFAVDYGQFWLIVKLFPSNPLTKSVAILRQLPDNLEYSAALKSRFDAVNNLVKAMLDINKGIVQFKGLPNSI